MKENYNNPNVKEWLEKNHVQINKNDKLSEEIKLMQNTWNIVKQEDLDEKRENPFYAGSRESIKRLKEKKIWIIINPFYKIYVNIKLIRYRIPQIYSKLKRFIKKIGSKMKRVGGKIIHIDRTIQQLKAKISNKYKNRPSVVLERNHKFLKELLPTEDVKKAQRETKFMNAGKVSVIVPLFNTPETYLRDMIQSVLDQTYVNWELCLADGSDNEHPDVEQICKEYGKNDARIIYQKLEKNLGIADNTNFCMEMATGDYIALFDHDDMLHPSALFACMERINDTGAEFVYTDEMTFHGDSIEEIATLHFKPDFSPQTLKGVNYICHLSLFKRELLKQTGMFDKNYDGSQDHDMVLKLTSTANRVEHIAQILYFWRVHPQSVSMNIEAKSYAIDSGRRAVKDHEIRMGKPVEVVSSCICATHYRLIYQMKDKPLISILVLVKNEGKALAALIDSIKIRTEYENYEICIADIESTDSLAKEYLNQIQTEDSIHVTHFAKTDSFGYILNEMTKAAHGELVTYLYADTEILSADWLDLLCMYAVQPEIGVMGERFADENGMLREAGYILGLSKDKLCTSINEGKHFADLGYIGRMYYTHNVSAVALNGMMIRKNLWEELGQFDETNATYPEIDFCLKALEHKYEVALNPYAIHLQKETTQTCKKNLGFAYEESKDAKSLIEKWSGFFAQGDPYYNPNMAKDGSFTYAIDKEGNE